MIRRFGRRDVDRWQAWPTHADPLLAIHNPRLMTDQIRDVWWADLIERQQQVPYAVDVPEERTVGRIFLRDVQRTARSAVLGVDFSPAYVDRGYGTDALTAFLRYYFERLEFETVHLTVAGHNTRARNVYDRLGFVSARIEWHPLQLAAGVSVLPLIAAHPESIRKSTQGIQQAMHKMILPRGRWARIAEGVSVARSS
jgi:RimJ/RimL family protein N-acetyltransferase